MQAKELRIGNYINYKLNGDKQLINVNGIVGTIILTDSFEGDVEYFYPIPITEEYLINLGFEKSDVIPQDNNEAAWQLPDDEAFYVILGEDPVICLREYGVLSYFDYVHELQNIYYALDSIEIVFK